MCLENSGFIYLLGPHQPLLIGTVSMIKIHREDTVGSIEVGMRADLVVLDKNLFEIPSIRIGETRVRFTLFEEKIVYQAHGEN